MSKVGYNPIIIEEGTKVNITDNLVEIVGTQGSMKVNVPSFISLKITDDKLHLERINNSKKVKSQHGLFRSLINNAVIGVSKPWEKKLELVGTGYGVKLVGEDLEIKVGFSHPVIFKKTDGVKFQVEGNKKIVISGVNKQLVGEAANKIRSIKKPDAYKGKGLKYEGEVLRIKP
ncbi:MAG: 50S ribosomal protein L6, partial [Patescibacteria group bacterium]